MLQELLDILLPRVCIVCGDRLDRHEKHLCLHCIADMPLTYSWISGHNPVADRFNAIVQKDLENFEPYIFASSLFFYSGEADYRKIPYALKYHGNVQAGRFFGKMLGERMAKAEHFSDVDIVIPVPLHWTRAWKRGYNQAEVIAGPVAKALDAELSTDILYRRRRTKTQTILDVEHKALNVSGAFGVRDKTADKIKGRKTQPLRHILIVDDVLTTGATLKSCYKALRRHFGLPVRISVATLGFVQG